MSYIDGIKKSVVEGFTTGSLSTTHILTVLGVSAVMGLYIFFIYRITIKRSFYSSSFNKGLAFLPVITACILLAMQSNLVISLGMVGALSIVRFRNAVKDTMDLVFLFWSISVGIVTGAGLFELSVLASLILTVMCFGIDMLPSFRAPFLLVISAENTFSEEEISETIKRYAKRIKLRSKNITKKSVELIYELHVKESQKMVNEIMQNEAIININLLTHDGEVRF